MIRSPNSLICAAAPLALALAPVVLGHGDDDDMSMGMDMPANTTSESSYFSYPGYKTWIWAHVAVMIIAWCFIAPIAVMLSVAKSRCTFPWQALFVVLNAVGVLLGFIYDVKVPNLYEHNVHYRMGWLFTWISLAWILMGIVYTYTRKTEGRRHSGQQMSAANMAQHHCIQQTQESERPRWSRDSGQGTERNSVSLFGSSRSGSASTDYENRRFDDSLPPSHDDDEIDEEIEVEKRSFLRNNRVDRFLSTSLHKYATGRVLSINKWTYIFFERTMLIFGFFAISSGFVVFSGIARGKDIFNLLAHFIKGGIFFWYGLLTLGRWAGALADLGWAWNVKPPASAVGSFRAWVPSGEFTESFVIFLYGVTNVWLEHLGAEGGKWEPEDLQHISITVLFTGGGLLGMLIESERIKGLLHTYILRLRDEAEYTDAAATKGGEVERWKEPERANVQLNPMPALVILLLGIMMSAHTQHSMVSSMLHKQWGNLFAGFSLARMVTYVLFYLKPYNSHLPSRPPTEIITSFCLVSGGLMFMSSTWSIVATLEELGIGAMFVFTCTMGLTAGVMAWETFLLALKGWAERKENPVLVRRLAAQSQNEGASASV